MLPIEERRPSSTQHSHRETQEEHSDQDRGDQGGGPREVTWYVVNWLSKKANPDVYLPASFNSG